MAGIGRIKGTGPTPKKVIGLDANMLYPSTFEDDVATGIAARYDPINGAGEEVATLPGIETEAESRAKMDDNGKLTYKKTWTDYGFDEMVAVNYIHQQLQQDHPNTKLTLRHKFNGVQKVFRFGKQRLLVDGWIREIGTIIQYHGCYWHGHQCHKTRNTEQERLLLKAEETLVITNKLKNAGYRVIEVRECEFQELQRQDPLVKRFVESFRMPNFYRYRATMDDIITEIRNGLFFGLVEVDIQVPHWCPDLREGMSEFPPIFKNTEVGIDDIGPTMAAFATETNQLKKPRRTLIGSYFGNKILLATPLVKWYLDHGLEITRLHCAIQYLPKKALSHLPEETANQRRLADADPNRKAYGELFKLLANSYYGKCLCNVEAHQDVAFLNRKDAAMRVRSPLFRKLEPITEGIYQVHLGKSKINHKLPITISFMVYAYAKLAMLRFLYDFIRQVLDYDQYELLEMDTDSFYFALSHETLEEAVPAEKRPIYDALKHKFLALTPHDFRTPGLFKVEYTGNGMFCISPNTYIAFTYALAADGTTISNIKISTKGLSKELNALSAEDFLRVLLTREPISGENRGFVTHNGQLFQYCQRRIGIGFLYIKRKVQPDGITTLPLDI